MPCPFPAIREWASLSEPFINDRQLLWHGSSLDAATSNGASGRQTSKLSSCEAESALASSETYFLSGSKESKRGAEVSGKRKRQQPLADYPGQSKGFRQKGPGNSRRKEFEANLGHWRSGQGRRAGGGYTLRFGKATRRIGFGWGRWTGYQS
jgi:hypothetical protein